MSDRPWLEDGDPALRAERELLKRLNTEQPPVGSVEQGWAALAAEISGAPPLDPGLTSGPAPVAPHTGAGASTSLAAKALLGVALAGSAWWGGNALWSPPAPPTAPAPSLAPSARMSSTSPSVAATSEPPAALPERAISAPERSAAPRGASATTLAEEGRLLAEAHRLVQSGQPQRALEVLRASQARYPRSVLAQEREVLTIEALYAGGSSGSARQRAEQFLKRHPKSPHAERLQRFVE